MNNVEKSGVAVFDGDSIRFAQNFGRSILPSRLFVAPLAPHEVVGQPMIWEMLHTPIDVAVLDLSDMAIRCQGSEGTLCHPQALLIGYV